jgi:hypothetical protein
MPDYRFSIGLAVAILALVCRDMPDDRISIGLGVEIPLQLIKNIKRLQWQVSCVVGSRKNGLRFHICLGKHLLCWHSCGALLMLAGIRLALKQAG